jgi:phosphatidylglycerol:prolipoprotein diacylglycerol transferase
MAYPYLTDALNDVLGTDIHLPLATFGAFVALALLVAIRVTRLDVVRLINIRRIAGIDPDQAGSLVTELAFVATLCGLIGAKLFDAIEQPGSLLENPLEVIFSTGGFSIYGGLIMGMLAGIIYLKRKSIPVLPMMDAVAPALALGYGIGRLGCQVSGDGDWGKAANMELKPQWLPDWLWAQTYPNNVLQLDIPPPGVYPTPLYEAAGAFVIFLLLWSLRNKLKITGQLFFVYLILSSSARWLVETIRINYQYNVFGVELSQAQIISMGLILISILGLLLQPKVNYQTTQRY